MAKMNIYVADALKRRMDEVEGMNWSQIACQAFEAKLAEVITKRGAKDMEEVIARLKASKAKGLDDIEKRGREAGRNWAMHEADALSLERLYQEKESQGHDWYAMFNLSMNNPYEISFSTISGLDFNEEFDEVRSGADQFWSAFLGDGYYDFEQNADFAQSFLEAAIDFWAEVRDRV